MALRRGGSVDATGGASGSFRHSGHCTVGEFKALAIARRALAVVGQDRAQQSLVQHAVTVGNSGDLAVPEKAVRCAWDGSTAGMPFHGGRPATLTAGCALTQPAVRSFTFSRRD